MSIAIKLASTGSSGTITAESITANVKSLQRFEFAAASDVTTADQDAPAVDATTSTTTYHYPWGILGAFGAVAALVGWLACVFITLPSLRAQC